MKSHPTDASSGDILVVDDTHENLRLLTGILTEQGYQVRPVTNGPRALAAASATLPDLILLDIMMPDMDGYAVCEALKANEQTRNVPIIFISALHETSDKVKAFAVGGVDYITKPFQSEEVLARVHTHLTIQRMRRQMEQQNDQLQQINQQLEHSIDALERRNLEMRLLNRMNAFLQRAESASEAIDLCLPFLHQMFADNPGALYLLNATDGVLQQTATWGAVPPAEQEIAPATCMAFAGTRMNLVEDPEEDLECEHCCTEDVLPYLCIQLKTRGEPLGLLHLRNGPRTEKARDHWQRVAMMVADQLALALSNLRLREQLRVQSVRDTLTGLFNRSYLDDTIERELHRAARQQYEVGCILLDIDDFNHYNEIYGHDGGDAFLQHIGALLRTSLRLEDIACRAGEDEFLLMLPAFDFEATRQVAETLCTAIRRMEVQHEGQRIGPATVSVGIASFPVHGATLDAVMAAAQAALIHAYESGGNQVVLPLPVS